MQGGKFGHGFLSAGVSKAATPAVTTHINGAPAQAVTLAIVGGTVSEVTGGKFANGAITSAMAFAFNHQLSEQQNRDSAGYGRRYDEELVSYTEPGLVFNEPSDIDWQTVFHGEALDVLTFWRKSIPYVKEIQILPSLQRARVFGTYHYKFEIVYENLQAISKGGLYEYYRVDGQVHRTGEFVWKEWSGDPRVESKYTYRTC